MNRTVPIPFGGGRDRTVSRFYPETPSFFTMHDLMYNFEQPDSIIQTRRFYQYIQYTAGTYYLAGSQTEPTTSAVRGILPGETTVTDYVINRAVSTQVQIFYQTTQPAAETIYTGLLLNISNVTAFGITLGSTFDVEMTATAAFRWRKNGGGWTAGVPSTAGVSIDGGNATLYFLASTGYAGTEAWAWTRTDYSCDNVSFSRDRPIQWIADATATFFLNKNDRVMRLQGSGTNTYAISAGYRAVYASFLTLFSQHLILQDAAKTAVVYTARVDVVMSSDKADYNNFISTDVNEADTYQVPNTQRTYQETGFSYGIGMVVIGRYLFIFNGGECFYTPDYGLPLVFSFERFGPTIWAATAVVPSANGAYILAGNGVMHFNGEQFQVIGLPINDLDYNWTTTYGIFDALTRTLILTDPSMNAANTLMICYNELRRTWFTRSACFDASSPYGPCCFALNYGSSSELLCGARSRKLLREDAQAENSPVFDHLGTTWGTPTLRTQLILSPMLRTVEEIVGTYIDIEPNWIAQATAAAPNATYYVFGTGTRFKLSWYLPPVRDNTTGSIPNSPTYTSADAYTDSSKPDGFISWPRTSFRRIALEITLIDPNGVKPPCFGGIYGLELVLAQGTATR